MNTHVNSIAVKTVRPDYSWDIRVPDISLTQDAVLLNENTYIGYAPYLHVSLSASLSSLDPKAIAVFRKTNFGDYYNSETNIQTTTLSSQYKFCHAYVMPGLYEITFDKTQYINIINEDLADIYIEPGTETVKARPPFAWTWKKLTEGLYEELENSSTLELGNQCITWEDTEFQSKNETTWDLALGPAVDILDPLSAKNVQAKFNFKMLVVEIPPTAVLTLENANNSVEVSSPFEARLTAQYTRCGSFPIEKIIWDFGDGSPLVEISRFNIDSLDFSNVVFNKKFERDYYDPRNFDVKHIYTRTDLNSSLFYPSITAVASSTETSNCASTVIGPLILTQIENFDVLQTQLKYGNRGYIGEVNKNSINFWSNNK